jgi:hypothetical protein
MDVADRTDQTTYYLYLPKRYAKAFTPKDIDDINCDGVWWTLVNKSPEPITKMYILHIE